MLHTAHRLAVRRCYGGSMSSAQTGRPRRGALHGGLAVRPVVPGPARPRLPQVEPRRAGRLAEPARHPRPRRAEPRLDGLRRPHRRGLRRSPPRRCGCCGCRSTTATRRPWRRCPQVDTSSSARLGLPRVRDARRRRAGAEGPRRRVVRPGPAATTSTPRRPATAAGGRTLPTRVHRPWRREMATGRGGAGSPDPRSLLARRGFSARQRLLASPRRRPRRGRAVPARAPQPTCARSSSGRPTSAPAWRSCTEVGESEIECLQAADAERPGLRPGGLVRLPAESSTSPAPRASTATTATPATATRPTTGTAAYRR